jgi:hypothetical protein
MLQPLHTPATERTENRPIKSNRFCCFPPCLFYGLIAVSCLWRVCYSRTQVITCRVRSSHYETTMTYLLHQSLTVFSRKPIVKPPFASQKDSRCVLATTAWKAAVLMLAFR